MRAQDLVPRVRLLGGDLRRELDTVLTRPGELRMDFGVVVDGAPPGDEPPEPVRQNLGPSSSAGIERLATSSRGMTAD